jgi:hypothetical protein
MLDTGDRVGGLSYRLAQDGGARGDGVQTVHQCAVLGARVVRRWSAPPLNRHGLAVVVAGVDEDLGPGLQDGEDLVQRARAPSPDVGQGHHQRGPRMLGAADGNTPAAVWSPCW